MEPLRALSAVSLLCSLLVIFPAILLERKRKIREPDARPYAWGYFIGLHTLIFFGLLAVIAVGAGIMGSLPALGSAVVVATASVSGYYCIKRYRWGWVLATLASMNPIWWIINAIYGTNRWREFR